MPNTRNRVTVAGTAYHQLSGRNPFSVSLNSTMHLASDEQVYSRTPPDGVGEEWENLDLGWIEECSICYIKNNEKIYGPLLEVGFFTPMPHVTPVPAPLYVPPGMITMLFPTGDIAIRCKEGQGSVSYTVHAIPG